MKYKDKSTYKSGYKYKLNCAWYFDTEIYPPKTIETDLIRLTAKGSVRLRKHFSWNGANMCPDFKTSQRGTALHDALFQLLGSELLDMKWLPQANKEMLKACKRSGMWAINRSLIRAGLRIGSRIAVKIKEKILTAP